MAETSGRHTAQEDAARRRAGRRRARSRRRWSVAALASVTILLIAGAGALYLQLNGNIKTFDASGESKDRPPANAAVENVAPAENLISLWWEMMCGMRGGSGVRRGPLARLVLAAA
ncbi:hypothetical protein AB0N14_02110 [Streptomyces sp. NPDC051104]|uniref:hypothetical protein n=1 Tax=Streptomyces sp. NPDC051104 TaxID=3155044 RepID=UPI0034320F68